MFQAKETVVHLISDRELLLAPEFGEYIVFLGHGAEPFLIPGNHISGNIALHSCFIAVLKADSRIHAHLLVVPVDFAFTCVEVYLKDVQIVYTEGMENVIASFLEFADQIAPFQGRYNKVCRSLEHIRCVFQRLHRRVVHAVKADDLLTVIEGNHYKRADILQLQSLIRKGVGSLDIFQVLDDYIPSDAEIPIPAGTHFRRDILKIFFLWLYPVGYPLISVVIASGFVPFKYIGTFPVQRFSQILQQHCQRLVRSFLQ